MAQARRRLGSLVYEPALADASDIDKTFLLAMAKDDGPSKMADIQQRLAVNGSYASQYRLRLIAAELIEPKRHGYVDFALPYLRSISETKRSPRSKLLGVRPSRSRPL